ncbi:Abi family protein [Pseudidiomarina sediminum]|uniref:Abi family protein n=1 Tax=Pseudidiomarina sediminum TaxID=431675 RepID=UPI001C97A2F3|nr:Abi family protein [Pseudidiomarina sediminum]MBY6064585.1 Abi family protein [Pseudidiomarina sediminum]
MNEFTKPAIDIPAQVELLQARGLTIQSPERAARYLEVISFFRLSAYMRPFQKPKAQQETDHQFKEGTEFKQIVNLYSFDRELRLIVMDALERVEVAVRAALNNVMGTTYQDREPFTGSHWYLNEQRFKREYPHKRLLKEVEDKQSKESIHLQRDIKKINQSNVSASLKEQRIERRRRENYARFYHSCYDAPRLMPGWAMAEELTFGSISHLYRGLARDNDRKKIAKRFELPQEVFESWLHSLNFIRNCCAHHSRLWNRELSIPPKIPNGALWDLPERLEPSLVQPSRRIYMVLLMLAYLMRQVSPDSQWHNKVKALVTLHPEVPLFPMGFTENWYEHQFFN